MSVKEIVLQELEKVTGTDEVKKNLELELFAEKVLDSFGTVELMVALSDAFSIEITPGQVEREQWATPNKIIDYIEARLQNNQGK